MKDIYELLNGMDFDESEFEPMEVSEVENEKVKRALKKSIKQKNRSSWKKGAAAAAIFACLSAGMVGMTFPAYASSIPVVGDLFKFLDTGKTGMYDHYKEFSTGLNLTEESSGIKVTIQDAVYDGKTVSMTYVIESDKKLAENLLIGGSPEIKGSQASAGSSQITKVDDHHYVGLFKSTNLNQMDADQVNMEWKINSLSLPDSHTKIKGDWNFAFSLNAAEQKEEVFNLSAKKGGVQVSITKISQTPMSFSILYIQKADEKIRDQWDDMMVELDVKDNLGNSYSGEGNGGSGKDAYSISSSSTFEKLDPKATELIVTPHVQLRKHTPENHGEAVITEDGEKREIPVKQKPGKVKEEIVLDAMVIPLRD
ncbi:DUF4179 domain-containing protein [Bacillus sp. FJAT-42376]|uniref:DUF4179 domain-containing protein n=1 Tax=Bacillus sp. FJAT-42376 TaxID=2014076 RepID=UPI000F4E2357|nr:DUF4179 domain-containing protein [Bacillus sp. FJAT-42376]AZB41492.1 DUF4179 domain-containing protein [Bacillus sp. FJAT-42376]